MSLILHSLYNAFANVFESYGFKVLRKKPVILVFTKKKFTLSISKLCCCKVCDDDCCCVYGAILIYFCNI